MDGESTNCDNKWKFAITNEVNFLWELAGEAHLENVLSRALWVYPKVRFKKHFIHKVKTPAKNVHMADFQQKFFI